jgi:hypothetical protein
MMSRALGDGRRDERVVLAGDARAAAAQNPLDLLERRHRRVARRRHREGTVGDPVRQRRADVGTAEKAVDQTEREGVAAPDTVEDLEPAERRAHDEPVALGEHFSVTALESATFGSRGVYLRYRVAQ